MDLTENRPLTKRAGTKQKRLSGNGSFTYDRRRFHGNKLISAYTDSGAQYYPEYTRWDLKLDHHVNSNLAVYGGIENVLQPSETPMIAMTIVLYTALCPM